MSAVAYALPFGLVALGLTGLAIARRSFSPVALPTGDGNGIDATGQGDLLDVQDRVIAQAQAQIQRPPVLAGPHSGMSASTLSIVLASTLLVTLHAGGWAAGAAPLDSLAWAPAWASVALVIGGPWGCADMQEGYAALIVIPYLVEKGCRAWFALQAPTLGLDCLGQSQVLVASSIVLVLLLKPGLHSSEEDENVEARSKLRPPTSGASLLSRAFFAYITPVLWSHRNTAFTPDAVPDLEPVLTSAHQVAKYRSQGTQGRLLRRLLLHNRKQVSYQLVLAILSGAAAVAPSWALQRFLRFLTLRSKALHDPTYPLPPWQEGIVLALGIFAGSLAYGVLSAQASWIGRVIWANVRGLLSAEVMGKVLRRSAVGDSSSSKDEHKTSSTRASDGRVTTLLSVDVTPLGQQLGELYETFPLAPVQVIGSLYMLIRLVGWPAWAGLAVVLLLLPVQTRLGKVHMRLNKDVLKCSDQRQDAQAELLRSATTIKLFAWEGAFKTRLSQIRNKELASILHVGVMDITQMATWISSPILAMSIIVILHTTILHRPMTAEVAFSMIPLILNSLVSLRRIESFLNEPETDKYKQLQEGGIRFSQNASFTHVTQDSEGESFVLRDLDISFPHGRLSLVCGPVASGKSTLLESLLGETRKLQGSVYAPRSDVAYVGQRPWLQSATVQANILSGQEWDAARYSAVLTACSLRRDLDQLAKWDRTPVGPRGVTLSGGQQVRVALARALYSSASLLLLDDTLSAFDAQTAEDVFRQTLTGPLSKGRTVVLATNNLALTLRSAAHVVVLKDGGVVGQGAPSSLLQNGVLAGELSAWLKQAEHHAPDTPDVTEDVEHVEVKEETCPNTSGAVSLRAYQLYFLSMSPRRSIRVALWITVLSLSLAVRTTEVAATAWLKKWAESYGFTGDAADPPVSQDGRRTMYYLKVYLGFSALRIFLDVISVRAAVQASLNAARGLYARVLDGILAAPPSFFDTTPVGRIINVLSHDVEAVDRTIGSKLELSTFYFFEAVAPILVIFYQIPRFSLVLAMVFLTYSAILRLYLHVFRDLRRLEVAVRSPLYTTLSDVLSGLSTIRAAGQTGLWYRKTLGIIDQGNRLMLFQWMVNGWLQVSISMIGAVLVGLLGITFVLNTSIDAALAGFVLSLTVTLAESFDSLVRVSTGLDVAMTSIERMEGFINLPSEKYEGTPPPAGWPSIKGNLEVHDLSIRYSPSDPRALDAVSLAIPAGSKTALCGFSGSGKSTLALSFLRGVEPETGAIILDGLDLSTVPLTTLRERIAYVPQRSDLFAGTVRSALDPLNQFDDTLIWAALVRCRLARVNSGTTTPESGGMGEEVTRPITSLDMPIESEGANLSHGQRQLLSLARGMLRLNHSRWLILDEPTAALDASTDTAIQALVNEVTLSGVTVIAIAHRLHSIITWDQCVVLEGGKVVEVGEPYLLLKQKGAFHNLATRSGDLENLFALAKEAYESRHGKT